MRLHPAVAPLLLAGCALMAPVPDVTGVDAVLIGEQHDARAHPRLQERWVAALAQRDTLSAVTLEMAERGTSTAGLPRSATEEQVRQALQWNQAGAGWPWERYAPAVMAAVRAGVPVLGANLPRAEQRQAMADRNLDDLLPGPAIKAQQQAIRRGHCDMLPESQVMTMTRVQIARDVAMARTIAAAARPGKTVVLLAGSGHVQPDIGVPQHLPGTMKTRPVVLPAEETGKDYCAEFRRQMEKKPA
jgi:uncharacterized iron-regulated protein